MFRMRGRAVLDSRVQTVTTKKVDVALLGATGSVGQRYVRMLSRHPYFNLRVVVGRSSVGRRYGEAVRWMIEGRVPDEVAEMKIESINSESIKECKVVFSALPSEAALEAETRLAGEGLMVVSEASAHRMDEDVPLLIPEVNPDHLRLVELQKRRRGWEDGGAIVTTPNCTAVGLDMVLAPLLKVAPVSAIVVNTMQAVSGAGYLGVPSMSILENVIPFVKDEEEKVVRESYKILGRLEGERLVPAFLPMAVSCNRVPTLDGHMESVLVEYKDDVEVEDCVKSLATFEGEPQKLRLPTSPARPIVVRSEQDRPQPRLDRMEGTVPGMSVVVGRVRRGWGKNTVQMTLLSHNTVRGAAGGAILTAELMHAKGLF
jgi:aspartate-semialdehyde dehydrogenase